MGIPRRLDRSETAFESASFHQPFFPKFYSRFFLRDLSNNGGRKGKVFWWKELRRQDECCRGLQEAAEPLCSRRSSVPLWSCQAFPQAKHSEQDARGSKGCRVRHCCSRVSD